MAKLTGKVLIAQGGGPTAVINQSLVGAVLESRKFPEVTRVYGATNPVLSGTLVGVHAGDDITATYSTIAMPASSVGSYPIAPTLIDPTGKLEKYLVSITNGTLTVTKAPLTITADDATRGYGAANPPFSGTITGRQNGDNITATYATAATVNSPPGAYPITPTLAPALSAPR